MSNASQSLTTLVQVCSAFFDRQERSALIGRILNAMIEVTHGDRGTIFLVPEIDDAREMTSLIATGLEGKEIRVDINQGIAGHVFRTGAPIVSNDVRNDKRFYSKIDEQTGYQTTSMLTVPLRTVGGRTLGVIEILNSKRGAFNDGDLQVLQVLSLFAAIALEHRLTLESLDETNDRIKQVRMSWIQKTERIPLRSTNKALQSVYDQLPNFAQSDSSILVEGESGTGKEVIAQLVHAKSPRRDRPFVAVNCAAIPETLFEAELFGVAKGAATGTSARRGKMELAHGGTLFLDEIGELPLSLQAKLLRVLQDRTVARVGSDDKPRPVDFRVVAATNRDLAAMVRDKKFREDLFYRINVVRFHLPPLRERAGDIPDIVHSVLEKFHDERGWKAKALLPEAMEKLMHYPWPGNIRQLQNKIENAMILSGARSNLGPQDFQLDAPESRTSHLSLAKPGADVIEVTPQDRVTNFNLRDAKEMFEIKFIERALQETGGNKSQAAKLLGITREGLRKALLKRENVREVKKAA